MRREITPTQIANAIRDLIDEKEQLEDQIMNEITEFCRDCESCQCCPEDDCIFI